MTEYRMRTAEGRTLLVRPAISAPRPQVQIAILSTRGNIMEAVTVEAPDVLALARGAGKVAVAATRRFNASLAAESRAAALRYREALARNPWLNGERP